MGDTTKMYTIFRERIVEEKKRLGVSVKSMSERSKLQLPEETITRVITGKTGDPGVSTISDIGETVGLAPYELFMDATLAAEFRAYLELKSKAEETELERIRITAENESLKATNAALASELDMLRMQLRHRDELLTAKNDLIELYKQMQDK